MSRTIRQLDTGIGIWLKENNEDVEYILLHKDSQGAVILRKDAAMTKRMNPTNTTVYTDSEMDQFLCDEETGFLSRFDAATRMAFSSRSISTFTNGDTECTYIDRRCYLLSQGNMFITTPTAIEPEPNYVHALMKYYGVMDANTARIGRLNGNVMYCWLRSPYSDTYFYSVGNNGISYSHDASGALGCRPALNVSLDTIVSDEGAEKIYLLPEQGYREVLFSGMAFESTAVIKRAMVNYNAVNLTDVKVEVCNNYGDENPVWEDATAQKTVTFTNESKQTDKWQIGVRCYGRSDGYGYFEEPIIKMEVA